MRRLWLLFAQTVTIGLALWFIVATLKPEWITQSSHQIHIDNESVSIRESSEPTSSQNTYRQASQRAMPSVVNIFTTKAARQSSHPLSNDPLFRHFFGDGRKVSAKLIGTDPETDLAVIKIGLKNLPAITLGRLESTKVGDVVLAIGNPFGVGQTVTMGIVSALGRNHLGINTFENFIQTDAAINPGNSGGALVDSAGNLLGINTAIYSRSGGSMGIGFAIPVTTVKNVMEAIIKNGQVVRGWIGVEPQDITPELATSFGLAKTSGTIIAGVLKGGPADKAGVKPGDILISVGEKSVTDTTSMLNLVAQLTPGEKTKLTILRKSRELIVEVTVGKRPRMKQSRLQEDE